MDIADYPEVTPERIALLQLNDCARLLREWEDYPLRLIQAAKAAHLALHAALTAALAGTANIGVFRPGTRAGWLQYFDNREEGTVEPPADDYILPFSALFAAAKEGHPHGYLTEPLQLSEDEQGEVDRLTQVRHWFEHPRPRSHYIQPSWVAEAIPTGARLALKCLNAVWHHLEFEEQEQASRDVANISALCSVVP